MQFTCGVCLSEDNREELVEEIFNIDGRYVVVSGVPSTLCLRCGERAFSRETAEKVRLMVHGEAKPRKSVSVQVYEFA